MTQDWEVYICLVDGRPASIMLDLAAHDTAPDRKQPHLLWTSVYLQAPCESGFPQRSESEALERIEDRLIDTLRRRQRARFVGRITNAGRRSYYFYALSPRGWDKWLHSAMSALPEYRYDHGDQPDPDWSHYLDVLYPNKAHSHCIGNRRIFEQLQENGDTLETPREVDHWSYFRTAESRRAFREQLQPLGFAVREESEDAAEEYPFGVCIYREETLDPDVIDDLVVDLDERAAALDGEYDGWETVVIPKGA